MQRTLPRRFNEHLALASYEWTCPHRWRALVAGPAPNQALAFVMSTPTALFAITAADIDPAGRSIDADLPPDWLNTQLADTDARATNVGHLSARLSRSGNEIVVRGKTRASLEVSCGRCLSPTKLDIEGDLSLLLQPAKPQPPEPAGSSTRGASGKKSEAGASSGDGKGKKAKEKDLPEYEFSTDEADVDTYDGETVVLDEFVREAILLEMPIFPLCSEDCPGIRPASSDVVDGGAEPRIDPRLAPLGALRAMLAQSKTGQDESNDESGARPRNPHVSQRKKTK